MKTLAIALPVIAAVGLGGVAPALGAPVVERTVLNPPSSSPARPHTQAADPGAATPTSAPVAGGAARDSSTGTEPGHDRWAVPVSPTRVLRPFQAPPQPWLPGHRGVDLRAPKGSPVTAPADGRIAFVGVVAGRGVVSIDHPDPAGRGTIRTTYEPVTPRVHAGDAVRRGDVVAVVSDDGHCAGGCVHWGARRGDTYTDPLMLLRGPVRLWPPLRQDG